MNRSKYDVALDWVQRGILRVDAETGMVHQTFTTSLYTYERPIGALTAQGYVMVSLGARLSVLAHRLIWLAVHGQIEDSLVINHINSVRHDNRLANLELVTQSQNTTHALSVGAWEPWRKVTELDARSIADRIASGRATGKELALEYGISQSLISMITRHVGRFAFLNSEAV